jgi:membrane-associated phospholipid phosphatase
MSRPVLLVYVCLLAAVPAAAQQPESPDVAAPLSSVKLFLTTIASDFAHVPRPTNLEILAAGAALALAAAPYDRTITAEASEPSTWEEVLDPGQTIGHGAVQVGGTLAAYVVGRMSHNTTLAALGGDLTRVQVVNGAMTHALKLAWGRVRPDGTGRSFPSGHTSATVATAMVLQQHFGWKAGVPAALVAGYVGVSRLSENKHYASDVIFGTAIGIVAGRSVTVRRGHAQFRVAPFAVRAGGGVGFALVPSP